MKKASKEEPKLKSKSTLPAKTYTFPNVSNENCIRIALKLLGVTDEQYEKETKSSIRADLFPRGTVGNSSKAFFFISHLCITQLSAEAEELTMWYPPRTPNEQIEFKKSLFKLVQRLEAQSLLPKNMVLSKASIAGDPSNDALLQFLRVLTEMTLRTVYLERYSKDERLIQIGLTDSADGSLDSLYPFPFCESSSSVEPPLQGHELEAAKNVFRLHIERFRQKILGLRTEGEGEVINPQQLMSQLLEQRQIAATLTSKVSGALFSENRAFDRRVIIDKHRQLWREISSLSCPYAEPTTASVLRVEGDIAKMLTGWKTASGTHTLIDFNRKSEQLSTLKARCEQAVADLKTLREKLLRNMK